MNCANLIGSQCVYLTQINSSQSCTKCGIKKSLLSMQNCYEDGWKQGELGQGLGANRREKIAKGGFDLFQNRSNPSKTCLNPSPRCWPLPEPLAPLGNGPSACLACRASPLPF